MSFISRRNKIADVTETFIQSHQRFYIFNVFFIEQIFRLPGLGRFFVSSTLTRDYPMILALVLLVAVVWGITYLLTDVLYTWLDPRIRLL